MRTAMMAITTSSSIRVKPRARERIGVRITDTFLSKRDNNDDALPSQRRAPRCMGKLERESRQRLVDHLFFRFQVPISRKKGSFLSFEKPPPRTQPNQGESS